jgi:toxin ParE1/3/4
VAEIELLKLTTYVHARNRRAALRLHLRTRRKLLQLIEFPYSGRIGSLEGTRELVISNSPYVAVYTIDEGNIVVHHVFQTSQQWPPEDE